ncbi:hypothetical protein BT69DRAFT_1281735 [Atractiella rhizophila]|nr:hypothetical protein BT69DRAFT_1281735 [Atractiella rhizophila]
MGNCYSIRFLTSFHVIASAPPTPKAIKYCSTLAVKDPSNSEHSITGKRVYNITGQHQHDRTY